MNDAEFLPHADDEISGLDSQVLLSATLCAQAPYLAPGAFRSCPCLSFTPVADEAEVDAGALMEHVTGLARLFCGNEAARVYISEVVHHIDAVRMHRSHAEVRAVHRADPYSTS